MSERLAIRLNENDFSNEDLDKKAEKLDITRTDLVKKAIKVVLELDPLFIKNIDKIAKNANVNFADVIKGFAVRRIAEIDARKEVWGSSTVLKELQTTDQGSLDSNELYKLLKDEFIFRMEREKFSQIMGKQKAGLDLNEEEEKFLEKNI